MASFVPAAVVRWLHTDPGPLEEPRAETFRAAGLFADISGFTALTERLSGQGPAGVEDLTRLLNRGFAPLVDGVLTHGGDVVKFAGDSLVALWPVPRAGLTDAALTQATLRASGCALALQETLGSLASTAGVKLSLKVGVGAGEVTLSAVGGVRGRWEWVVLGPLVEQMVRAEGLAEPGGVVLSAEAWTRCRARVRGQGAGAGFAVLQGIEMGVEPRRAEPPTLAAEMAAGLRIFLPGAIRSRLRAGQSGWLAELRRVSALFVRLPDLASETPLARIQEVVRAAQEVLYGLEASLNKISVDDKGTVLVAAAGLPPLAHTDDPVRAVEAGLELMRKLPELGFRCAVGVATGRAFCGVVGSPARREYTMIGNSVNLAARLMQAAGEGVLCDRPTAMSARAEIDCEPLPERRLKGIPEPVASFRPLGRKRPRGQAPPAAGGRLIGRVRERGVLEGRLDAVEKGGTGGVVFVGGAAGIGKSRLLEYLVERARNRGLHVFRGGGDSVQQGVAYHGWRPVFYRLFGGPPEASTVLRRSALLQALLADESLSPRAPLLNDAFSFDLDETASTSRLAGEKRAAATRELLLELLRREAEGKPSVLVLDDAQWLDSASWRLAQLLGERLEGVLLAIAGRRQPGTEGGELEGAAELSGLARHPDFEELHLENVAPAEALELACQCLGVDSLPARAAALIGDRAEGHPFFTEELAHALRDAGFLEIDGRRCRMAEEAGEPGALDFPHTLQGALISRIDRLTASQQLALKTASVIGRVFEVEVLRDVHPLADEAEGLGEDLRALARLEMLSESGSKSGEIYYFKHAFTQECAYELMAYSQRRELHAKIATWYEKRAELGAGVDALLAHHWSRAVDSLDPAPEPLAKAVEALTRVGEHALQVSAYDEASAHLERALDLARLLPVGAERTAREVRLHLRRSTVVKVRQGWASPKVKEAYDKALSLCAELEESPERAQALLGLSASEIALGRLDEARDLAREALRVAQQAGDVDLRLEARLALANSHFWLGELEAARMDAQAVVALYEPERHGSHLVEFGQDPRVFALRFKVLVPWLLGSPDEALLTNLRMMRIAEELDHPFSLALALTTSSWLHQSRREVDDARIAADRLGELALDQGFVAYQGWAEMVGGWADLQGAGGEEGFRRMRRGFQLWKENARELINTYAAAMLAEASWGAGKPEVGLAFLEEGLAAVEQSGERVYEPELLRLRAELTRYGGAADAEERARADLWRAVELAQGRGEKFFALRASASLVRANREDPSAREALAECYGRFAVGHDTVDLRAAKRLLGEVGG